MILALCLAHLAWTPPAAQSPAKRPVVLSTDIGTEIDDQFALAHLALTPAVDLKGVVTSHAPNLPAPAAEGSAKAARDLLAKLPLKPGERPTVVAGSSLPLVDTRTPRRGPGVDFLLEQARPYGPDDRLVVVMIGPATDVASALLVDPSLARRIEVVAMAFDTWPEGKDPWNVKNDVAAWQVVMASKVPLVVGDGAVTKRHLSMGVESTRKRLAGRGEGGPYLVGLVEDWFAKHSEIARSATGDPTLWPIWDQVTTAYLLGLAEVEEHPRPLIRPDTSFEPGKGEGTLRWVTSIDHERLWSDLARLLEHGPGG